MTGQFIYEPSLAMLNIENKESRKKNKPKLTLESSKKRPKMRQIRHQINFKFSQTTKRPQITFFKALGVEKVIKKGNSSVIYW